MATISKQKDARARRDFFEELPKDKQTPAEKQVMKTMPTEAIIATVNKNKRNYKKYKITKRWKHVIMSEIFWSIMVVLLAIFDIGTMFFSLATIPIALLLVLQLFCTIMNFIGYRDKDYINNDHSIQVPHGFLWYL